MGQRFAYHYDRLLRLSALTNQYGKHRQFRYDVGGWRIADTGSTGAPVAPQPVSRARPYPYWFAQTQQRRSLERRC